jgi:signal transduction histidine kinase
VPIISTIFKKTSILKVPHVLAACLCITFLQAQNKQNVANLFEVVQHTGINDTVSIKAHYKIGTTVLKNNDYENAYVNFNLGFKKATRLEDSYLIALGNYHLGVYYYRTKDIKKAITFINEALVSFEAQNRQTEASKCHYKLGHLYKNISDFEKALAYAFSALKISEFLKDEKEIARASTQIGAIYLITGDYIAADNNFRRALKLQEKNNNIRGLVLTYLNLGALSQKQKKYEEALNYFHAGLAYIKTLSTNYGDSLDLKDSQAILYGNIGSTLREVDTYKESLEFLFKALAIKKELKINRSTAHTYNDIAETYMRMKAFDKAKEYALKGALLAKNEAVDKERWSYYLIAQCEYELENYKSSYDNFQIYNTLKDSIFTTEKAARFNEMQIQYDTTKRDYQIKAQEKDIVWLATQNKLKTQLLWFGGTGLLAVFGFILIFKSREKVRRNIKQQEQFTEALIEAQENERTRVSKDLHDSVGQQLTFIKKKAQNLEQTSLAELANTALEEVRSISRGLYPATLKKLGLTASIEQLLFDLDGESDLFFSVDIEDINQNFNEIETLNFYRFIQESVNNVLKHAHAKTLIVHIIKHKKNVEILIKDNGSGFQTTKDTLQNSLGLQTMAERIRILKGKLSIQSKKEVGTSIVVTIPVPV